MPRFLALLRGVNVGGVKVPMARLREVVADLGYDDVSSHIQSGNLLLTSSERVAAKVETALSKAIKDEFGYDVPVLVRTATQLTKVIEHNPFLDTGADPTTLHVGFLASKPTSAAVQSLDPDRSPPDEFEVSGREVYLCYPNGLGRSKLSGAYLEKRLGTTVTIRNWRVTNALLELLNQ